MRLGVFIPNWIGDATMCTPALRALAKQFGPDSQITGILRPYVANVLAGTRWLDDLIYYHPRSANKSERTWSVVSELRRRKLDAILLFTNSFRAGAMARLSGAPVRVGYVRYARGPLLTHKLFAPRLGRRFLPFSAIDMYLQVAYAFGCAWESPKLELATLAADETAADAVWEKFSLPRGNQVVVLNSGGAYGAAKVWPNHYFAELARRIVRESGQAVLVLSGPAEREATREIVRLAANERVVGLHDETVSIGLSKACVRRSRMLVTTDSGPRFFAAAFGVPSVALFGPTDTRWSATHAASEVCLQHRVPCGPCGKRTCPLVHHDCMRHLSVDRVWAAVQAQLDRSGQRKVA